MHLPTHCLFCLPLAPSFPCGVVGIAYRRCCHVLSCRRGKSGSYGHTLDSATHTLMEAMMGLSSLHWGTLGTTQRQSFFSSFAVRKPSSISRNAQHRRVVLSQQTPVLGRSGNTEFEDPLNRFEIRSMRQNKDGNRAAGALQNSDGAGSAHEQPSLQYK